jgi:hypothetical protein
MVGDPPQPPGLKPAQLPPVFLPPQQRMPLASTRPRPVPASAHRPPEMTMVGPPARPPPVQPRPVQLPALRRP